MIGQMMACGLALTLGILLASDEAEIKSLKKRVEVLERRTAPLQKICQDEDDFYEAFFRLVREGCERSN